MDEEDHSGVLDAVPVRRAASEEEIVEPVSVHISGGGHIDRAVEPAQLTRERIPVHELRVAQILQPGTLWAICRAVHDPCPRRRNVENGILLLDPEVVEPIAIDVAYEHRPGPPAPVREDRTDSGAGIGHVHDLGHLRASPGREAQEDTDSHATALPVSAAPNHRTPALKSPG